MAPYNLIIQIVDNANAVFILKEKDYCKFTSTETTGPMSGKLRLLINQFSEKVPSIRFTYRRGTVSGPEI